MNFRPFALAALLAAAFVTQSSAQTARQWFDGGPRPTRYEISVTPNAEAATFTGEERITIESDAALPIVTMNALDIQVSRATIDGAGVGFDIHADQQTLTLTPHHQLAAGRHVITVAYSGKIYDNAYGFFRVEYEANGQHKRALATQFEPGDARRFAPMWDQPNRRAVFSLTVTAPSDQMAVSNMPVARATHLSGGLTRTRFADTPAMASYLLFLAVGDFERVTRNVDGVELGVVVRRGEGHRAAAALQAGEESLRYYTQYFGIRFPLPKLDLIGIPGAGGFGAMENWGAILFFDQYLLADDVNSSESDRQRVFGFTAHEIAHMWFGDLVTMNWWDDLWLNEGFASWMAAKATEAVHPDWQPWLAQLTDGTATAMAQDARAATHPIVQRVNTIDDANLAFDKITYEKGLAVIRMLEAYVGEENFRNGVRAYLNAHVYGNAQTEDLWAALQTASGQPIADIAHSFTRQPGFPVVTAADTGVCTAPGTSTTISLHQRRFALDDAARTNELWSIPIVAHRLGVSPERFVMPAQADGSVSLSPRCEAYLVNAGQSGFFRALYDRNNFQELAHRFGELESIDQQGLLLDYYAFGVSGDASFGDYLDLVSALPASADPVLVMDTAGSMLGLAGYARGRASEAAVSAFGRSVLRPYLDRIGWDQRSSDHPNDLLMRATLIAALGKLGDDQVIAEAQRRVRASPGDPSVLPASIRGSVLSIYGQHASEQQYEGLRTQARNTSEFVAQRSLWLELASVSDNALARRTLDLTLANEIPRQIRTQVIAAVAAQHPRMAWDFLVAHRAAIEDLLDPLTKWEFPTTIAQQSSDPAIANELLAYAHDFPEGPQREVDAAVAAIRIRAQTISQRFPSAEQWIAAHNTTAAPQRRR